MGRPPPAEGRTSFTPDACAWPPPVRELKYAIARAALLASDGRIEPALLNLRPLAPH